ncbi:Protein of unknown function [Bacillus mycoides]|nr:Protein of unknown function [Bacillus mycoides]
MLESGKEYPYIPKQM